MTCADDPDLVGTGDCSNSIEAGWADNFRWTCDEGPPVTIPQ